MCVCLRSIVSESMQVNDVNRRYEVLKVNVAESVCKSGQRMHVNCWMYLPCGEFIRERTFPLHPTVIVTTRKELFLTIFIDIPIL